jgi:hypothetical protein
MQEKHVRLKEVRVSALNIERLGRFGLQLGCYWLDGRRRRSTRGDDSCCVYLEPIFQRLQEYIVVV